MDELWKPTVLKWNAQPQALSFDPTDVTTARVLLAYVAGVGSAVVWRRFVVPLPSWYRARFYASRPHARAGFCERDPWTSDIKLSRDAYAFGYSTKLKSPLWASYFVCPGSLNERPEQARMSFASDDAIPREGRASPSDFANTGYDRGHLAPAANVRFSANAARESSLLTNVVLQAPALNRGPWKRLEWYVRLWSKHHGLLAVVAGPVFPANAAHVTTLNGIAVPTGMFMAVLRCRFFRSSGIAFYFPNENSQAMSNASPAAFAMSLAELEARIKRPVFRSMPWRYSPSFIARKRKDQGLWPMPDPPTRPKKKVKKATLKGSR